MRCLTSAVPITFAALVAVLLVASAWAQTGIAPDRPPFDPDVCVYPEHCGISPPPPPPLPPGTTPPPPCNCQPHEICNAGSCQAAMCADGTLLLPGQTGIADCCGPCSDWDTALNVCVATCVACQDCSSNACIPRDYGAYAVCDTVNDQCQSCGTCQAVSAGACAPLTCPAGEACDLNTGVCTVGQPCAQVVNGVWEPKRCTDPTHVVNPLTCDCEPCPACTDLVSGACAPRACPDGETCNVATDQCETCPVAGHMPDDLGNCCDPAHQAAGVCCPAGEIPDADGDCCPAVQQSGGQCPACPDGEAPDLNGTCCPVADHVNGLCPCPCTGDLVPDGLCGCGCPPDRPELFAGNRCCPTGEELVGGICVPIVDAGLLLCECPHGGTAWSTPGSSGGYANGWWYCGPLSDWFPHNCLGSNRARSFKQYSETDSRGVDAILCESATDAMVACRVSCAPCEQWNPVTAVCESTIPAGSGAICDATGPICPAPDGQPLGDRAQCPCPIAGEFRDANGVCDRANTPPMPPRCYNTACEADRDRRTCCGKGFLINGECRRVWASTPRSRRMHGDRSGFLVSSSSDWNKLFWTEAQWQHHFRHNPHHGPNFSTYVYDRICTAPTYGLGITPGQGVSVSDYRRSIQAAPGGLETDPAFTLRGFTLGSGRSEAVCRPQGTRPANWVSYGDEDC